MYKYKENSPGMANTTYTKTVDNAATGKLPGNFQAKADFTLGDSDMYARAAVGEVIGFMIIVAALLEVRASQKKLVENNKYNDPVNKEAFATRRAVHLGIAFTIASYSLGQFSGGIFNAVLDIWMQLAVRNDANWDGAAWTGVLSTVYLLAPFCPLWAGAASGADWYVVGRIKEKAATRIGQVSEELHTG